jgi:hypothetical protein
MTLEVSVAESTEVLSLDELIRFVEDHVDLRDPSSFEAAAPALAALARNRSFLPAILFERLSAWRPDDPDHAYDQEALVLYDHGDFAVRALVWRPPAEDAAQQARVLRQAPYGICHNHTFTLLTVGYLGSGYRTEIYRGDPARALGYAGEPFEVDLIEDTTLPLGKVMLYHPWVHFHRQYQPRELSLSLNLISLAPEANLRNQLLVDPARGCITDVDGPGAAARVFLSEMLRALGDASLGPELERLASEHPTPEMRDFAYGALAELPGASDEQVWRRALQDPSERVRGIARLALDGKLPTDR